MRLEKRRIVYGSVIGAGAFIAGVLLVWLTVPVDRVNNLPEWRAAVWVFLDAHGITIETAATQNAFRVTTEPDLPTLRIGFALPFLLVAIGAALTVSGVSGTARLRYMIENGSAVLYGYLGVGLIALLESGAQPVVAALAAIVFILIVSMYVGSAVVGSVTSGIPFIGIASLGSVIVLGLVFLFVGAVILEAMLPMIIVAVGGAGAGILSLWSVRQAPR